jgi:hypothetical protein
MFSYFDSISLHHSCSCILLFWREKTTTKSDSTYNHSENYSLSKFLYSHLYFMYLDFLSFYKNKLSRVMTKPT